MVMSAATNVLIADFVPLADCSEQIGTSHDNGCTPAKLVCVNNIRNYFLEEFDGVGKIMNQHLWFLAYAASAKHGVLGKKNSIPVPDCFQLSIKNNYTDADNSYVGFKVTDHDSKSNM